MVFHKYFAPYISSYCSSYCTRHSKTGGNFLVIPKFQPSVHKSVKQFGHSFVFDAPTLWNALSEDIQASPLCRHLQKMPQNLPLHQSISSLGLLTPGILRGARTLLCPWSLRLLTVFVLLCFRAPFELGRLNAIKVQLELEEIQ